MKAFPVFLCLMVIFLNNPLTGQVINIESYRIRTDTAGWAGNAEASVYLNKNSAVTMTFFTDVQIQYKTKKSLWLFLNDVDFVTTDGDKFVNSGFQHFRYNYKITDRFVWEAFLQGQYNSPLAIEWRALAGTGPRYKIVGTEKFRLYAAALYMFEREKNTDIENPYNEHRLSSYVSFTIATNDNYSITHTTYYQPRFDDFADYRISSVTDLKVYFTKKFYMKFNYNILYDTRPPAQVVTTSYNITGALGFEFKN